MHLFQRYFTRKYNTVIEKQLRNKMKKKQNAGFWTKLQLSEITYSYC